MPIKKNKPNFLGYVFIAGMVGFTVAIIIDGLFLKQQQPSPNIVLESEPPPPVVEEEPLLLEEESHAEIESSYVEETEPPPIEPARPIEQFTKHGYLATVNEESLDLLLRAVNNQEYGLIENMLISGVAIPLEDGVRVVDMRCGGALCSRLTFRFPDNPTVYHTVNEAIEK